MFKKLLHLYERLVREAPSGDARSSVSLPVPEEARVLDYRLLNDIYFDDTQEEGT
jgi:hypothetical protein